MEIWHLRFSSDGRHPLFPGEAARRAAVLVVVRHAGSWLVVFGFADDHLHVTVQCTRAQAGKLSRALVLGLRPLSGLGFEPSFIKPVLDRAHLKRLVGYFIEQPARHGLPAHPAAWSGSCFSDIVGARFIGDPLLCVADVLPRYRPTEAWVSAGLDRWGIPPMSDEQIKGIGLSKVVDAAAFAVCANPQMNGRTAPETQARAIVVRLGRLAGFRNRDIAGILGISIEAVRKLGLRGVDDRAVRAARLRMAIVEAVPGNPN